MEAETVTAVPWTAMGGVIAMVVVLETAERPRVKDEEAETEA
jgi:hypothetical protein